MRNFIPKPISNQTLVITGASSGLGLATAKLACQQGATVVLCSRDESALKRIVAELQSERDSAAYPVPDAQNATNLQRVAKFVGTELSRPRLKWGLAVGMAGFLGFWLYRSSKTSKVTRSTVRLPEIEHVEIIEYSRNPHPKQVSGL